MKLASMVGARRKSTVSLVVKTREGKTYDLGVQKNYGFLKPYYKWLQDRKIKNYYNSRIKGLTNQKEIKEFTEQVEKIKVQLKGI